MNVMSAIFVAMKTVSPFPPKNAKAAIIKEHTFIPLYPACNSNTNIGIHDVVPQPSKHSQKVTLVESCVGNQNEDNKVLSVGTCTERKTPSDN